MELKEAINLLHLLIYDPSNSEGEKISPSSLKGNMSMSPSIQRALLKK